MNSDAKLYMAMTKEFDSDMRNEDVWATAMEMSDGEELRAKYLYIHLRVEYFKAAMSGEPAQEPAPPAKAAAAKGGKSVRDIRIPHKIQPFDDDKLYAAAVDEFDSNKRNEEIWAEALEKASGNLRGARYQYIRLRVESFKAAMAESAEPVTQSGSDSQQDNTRNLDGAARQLRRVGS